MQLTTFHDGVFRVGTVHCKPRKVNYRRFTLTGVKDILFGRGISKHLGNRFFRNYVDLIAPDYFDSTTRMGKTKIIEETLLKLSVSGYRFLKENGQGQMISLDPNTCRAKISHALRDRCRHLKFNPNTVQVMMKFKKKRLNVVQYAERLTRGDLQRKFPAESNNATADASRRLTKSKNTKDTCDYKTISEVNSVKHHDVLDLYRGETIWAASTFELCTLIQSLPREL